MCPLEKQVHEGAITGEPACSRTQFPGHCRDILTQALLQTRTGVPRTPAFSDLASALDSTARAQAGRLQHARRPALRPSLGQPLPGQEAGPRWTLTTWLLQRVGQGNWHLGVLDRLHQRRPTYGRSEVTFPPALPPPRLQTPAFPPSTGPKGKKGLGAGGRPRPSQLGHLRSGRGRGGGRREGENPSKGKLPYHHHSNIIVTWLILTQDPSAPMSLL